MERYIAALTTSTAAILFGMGYAYLNSYYSFFNISYSEIQFDLEDIIAHSAIAIKNLVRDYWPAVLSVLFVVAMLERETAAASFAAPSRRFMRTATIISCMFAWYFFMNYSSDLGERNAIRTLNTVRQTGFWIDADSNTMALIERVSAPQYQARLHLLQASKETLFVLITYLENDDFSVARLPRTHDTKFGVFRESTK